MAGSIYETFEGIGKAIHVQGTEQGDKIVVWYSDATARVEVGIYDGSGWTSRSWHVSELGNHPVKFVIDGQGGNDTIEQYTWYNTDAKGGQGDDTLRGGSGDDDLDGQGGTDYLYGGEGSDVLNGGDGSDELYGEGGQDYLYGDGINTWGPGVDWWDGYRTWEYGHDYLDGGHDHAADYLYGGGGGDTFVQHYGWRSFTWGGYQYWYQGDEDTIADYGVTRNDSHHYAIPFSQYAVDSIIYR